MNLVSTHNSIQLPTNQYVIHTGIHKCLFTRFVHSGDEMDIDFCNFSTDLSGQSVSNYFYTDKADTFLAFELLLQ